MPPLNLQSPNGWKKWIYPKTSVNGLQLPDSSFPPSYLPANSFWMRSLINHCIIPWLNTYDPFTSFRIAGGTAGTIGGSIAGLAVVNNLFPIFINSASFGIFGTAVGPKFGFCIGKLFKQQVYIRFDIQNTTGDVILESKTVELLENGEFKRVYVIEGEIRGFSKINGISTLKLDIDSSLSPFNADSAVGTLIKIVQPNGNTFKTRVKQLQSNWDIIIDDPGDNIPKQGDYYSINPIWCIEDPYLITGFWESSESTSNETYTSGHNLYLTNHNKPYEKGKFLGVYIWNKKDIQTTDQSFIFQPSIYSNMMDSGNYEWTFFGLGNSQNFSDIYKNDIRYKEEILSTQDSDGSIIKLTPMKMASLDDYNTIISRDSTECLRVQISTGGYYTRHNWQAPCLQNSYILCDNHLYKILSHIEADIIDVSIVPVGGEKISPKISNQIVFDPRAHPDYSIVNQNAWMITENYFQDPGDFKNTGIFEGEIISSNLSSDSTKVEIKVEKDPPVATKDKNGISLVDRYKNEIILPKSMVKLFKKYQEWRLIYNDSELIINDIQFGKPDSNGSYVIKMTLASKTNVLVVGNTAYIAFDKTRNTVSPYIKKEGYTIDLTANAGVEGSTTTFITSNVLCLDGQYTSNPYYLDIPINTRIGVCDGYLFGLESNGSAQSELGVLMLVTTLRGARGIASLFHALRQENWVVYQDSETQKMTIRRGCLDFKEYPSKDEVVFGNKQKNIAPNVNGNEVILDSSQERLRRLIFEIEDYNIGQSPSIMFGIGSADNVYGFLVSGDGLVDLQTLRYQGIKRGQLPSTTYLDSTGQPVSPVYSYKRGNIQHLKENYVNIGSDASKSVFIKNGSITSVLAQYVNNNQTIQNNGVFDIIRLKDGELLILYGQEKGEFNLSDGNNTLLNNSISNGTKWFNQNAVFMLGSLDDDFFWGTPTILKGGNKDYAKYQYPSMILNSVEYLASVYNEISGVISIFVKAFYENSFYIGCFKVSAQTLSNSLFDCFDSNHFFYRPPLLKKYIMSENGLIQNSTSLWIHGNSDIIKTSFDIDEIKQPLMMDEYVRVIGSKITNSQVDYSGEFGTISVSVLSDGTYVLLYDTNEGIKNVVSVDQGSTWSGSNVVMARNGRCGLILGRYLYYITPDGIMIKYTNLSDFSDVRTITMQKAEGKNVTSIEISKQDYFDSLSTSLIGSSPIDLQRLSGYISIEGITKLFFYDGNNRLKCMESKDTRTWIVADNF